MFLNNLVCAHTKRRYISSPPINIIFYFDYKCMYDVFVFILRSRVDGNCSTKFRDWYKQNCTNAYIRNIGANYRDNTTAASKRIQHGKLYARFRTLSRAQRMHRALTTRHSCKLAFAVDRTGKFSDRSSLYVPFELSEPLSIDESV